MAIAVIVDGPAAISVGTGSADALEALGYTEDGARVIEETLTIDVPGDQNGGPEGIPIDVQYLGEIHIVDLLLTKWDTAIEAKLAPKIKGGTAGQVGTAGLLYAGDSKSFRLLINTTNRPRNYLAAIPMGGWDVNKGTKYSRRLLRFRCLPVSGVIYNTTTT